VTPYSLALTTPDVTLEDPTAPAAQEEADVPAGTMLNASITGLGTAVSTNACLIVEWYPL